MATLYATNSLKYLCDKPPVAMMAHNNAPEEVEPSTETVANVEDGELGEDHHIHIAGASRNGGTKIARGPAALRHFAARIGEDIDAGVVCMHPTDGGKASMAVGREADMVKLFQIADDCGIRLETDQGMESKEGKGVYSHANAVSFVAFVED